jgi:hypothetical protein
MFYILLCFYLWIYGTLNKISIPMPNSLISGNPRHPENLWSQGYQTNWLLLSIWSQHLPSGNEWVWTPTVCNNSYLFLVTLIQVITNLVPSNLEESYANNKITSYIYITSKFSGSWICLTRFCNGSWGGGGGGGGFFFFFFF